MRSSRAVALAVAVVGAALAPRAQAQQTAQGFALERLYTSAPGGGWFVMDSLDMHGGLGGAAAITSGYAWDPLRVPDGSTHLPVVSHQAFADFGFAATYDRFRLYLDLPAPLDITGFGGTVGRTTFTAPALDISHNPDTIADPRVGLDARLLGEPGAPFRLGAGAQLIIPSGSQADYDSDGTYRAMIRAMVAGDVGSFTYAGQLGVHVRPLDESPTPDGPHGSELLFGVAGGLKLPLRGAAVIIGPELFGETAFAAMFGGPTTGLEALLTSRIEGTGDDGEQLRVKLGSGGGIDPQFGAPAWRIVIGLELFDHAAPHGRSVAPPLGSLP